MISNDTPVKDSRQLIGPWVAYVAALWAAVFAVFHIIWAAGWYPLLDAEGARVAFANPWKWAFDVLVAVMCLIAVPVALAPVMSWDRHLPRRLIYALACIGTALLVLRSTASLVQTGYLISVGRFHFAVMGIWEWWFHLGNCSVQLEHMALEARGGRARASNKLRWPPSVKEELI